MILSRIEGDATKGAERDDGVLNTGPSCCPPVTKDHTAVPKEMEVPKFIFQRRNFLASSFAWSASFPTRLKGIGMNVGQIFQLKKRGRAILSEEEYRTVIPIPAKAKVVLVGGDIDEDAFVKIQ